jgi:hypothetical protein
VTSAEGQGARFTVNVPRMHARELQKLPRFVLYLGNEKGAGARAVQVLRKKGFELVRDEGPEALRNLVHQPLEAVVVGPQVTGAAARLLWEAVRAAPTVRPLPVLWLGGRPAWVEEQGLALPALSRALGRALEPRLWAIEP